ncbi:OmpA family protein [Shewanella submarina]|uniref:OmpA family protein n=1 Tax=Shewanella submarina TaxID=2016376 RepID=A0ABV7GE90_9GAMM|nr:OmpA family protein [Shewanella submarina]MCL1036826.1 OmpA family protein [Shewanella submarina]
MSKWPLALLLFSCAHNVLAWSDTDLDGVPDLKDACPGTPKGLAVLANGCTKEPLSQLCLPTDSGNKYPSDCAAAARVAVHFLTGSAQLPQNQWATLADIARFLKTYPDTHMLLAGHADTQGGDKINLPLSLARAETVKQVLIADYDIGAERLMVSGEGSSMPAASNRDNKGKYLNRRVEFVIKSN